MATETEPVRIEKKIVQYVKSQGVYGETFSGILFRLLGLHKQQKKVKPTLKDKEMADKL